MPVTLDATAGGEDANSLASLEYADAYFGSSLSSDQWDALADEDTKKRALISATRDFEEIDWIGELGSTTQALPFPRYLLGAKEGDGTTIPREILNGVCEHALYRAQNATNESGQSRRARLQADRVVSWTLGDNSETYAAPAPSLSTEAALEQFSGRVQRLIGGWVRRGWQVDSGRRPSGRRWWPPELGG